MADPRWFVLELNHDCKCNGCDRKRENVLNKLQAINGVSMDMDKEKTKLRVLGPVKPETVMKMFEGTRTIVELLPTIVRVPAQINNQEMQTELQQNRVQPVLDQRNGEPTRPRPMVESPKPLYQQAQRRSDSHKVAPEPPGPMIRINVDKQMEKETLDCTKHGHELEEKTYNKPFTCDRCREYGFISGYRCKHCVYDLHKYCLSPEPTVRHDVFKRSTFKYRSEPGKFCDACGREIHGHAYSCEEDKLDLHPGCSKLPGKLCIGGTDFVLCKKAKYKCFWCKEEKPSWLEVPGLWYVSETNKFSCHVHCVSRVMHEAWKRGGLEEKALEKVDLKLVAKPKGSAGNGGGLFLGAVTIFLKIIIGTLFGDPTGLIVSALTEVIKELLTL